MKKMRDTDFVYASARVRAMQAHSLGSAQFNRLIAAKTIEEGMKVLSSYGFVENNFVRDDYEQVLTQTLEFAYQEVQQLSPIKNLVTLMRLPYDAHNLKVLVKSAWFKGEASNFLSVLGNVSPTSIQEQFRNENFQEVHAALQHAAVEAKYQLSVTKNPQVVDIILDKGLMKAMLEIVAPIQSKFLTHFISTKIDIVNIRTFVRAKRMRKEMTFFKNTLVAGGMIPISAWIVAYPMNLEGLQRIVDAQPYASYLSECIGELKLLGGSLSLFEKNCDHALNSLLAHTRFISFGPEVLFSFLHFKEQQVQAARIILASKKAGVSATQITERLREIDAS